MRLLICACLLALPFWPRAAPSAVSSPEPAGAQRVDFAAAAWTDNGAPAPAPAVTGEGPDARVTLPYLARGERWATTFRTEDAATARLVLDGRGGPDGLLYEVVLDGQRMSPAQDAWRPTPRDERTDLGPLWLGSGEHLVELVAREQPAGSAALHLRALELTWK